MKPALGRSVTFARGSGYPEIMLAVECFSLVVLALFVAVAQDRKACLRDALLISLGALLGEDTCIRAYGFYFYSNDWHVFFDKVPLVVLLIWPAVVLSATKIARAVSPRASAARLGAMVCAIVVFDAALIEPIAVHAHLWHWTRQGIFHVPIVGILGWGFYAGCIVFLMERTRGPARVFIPAASALGTHGLLLVSYWGLFRYVLRYDLPFHVCVGLVLPASLYYVTKVVRAKATLSLGDLAARGAATSLFVYLLAKKPDAELIVYAMTFTLPHLVLAVASLRARAVRPVEVVST